MEERSSAKEKTPLSRLHPRRVDNWVGIRNPRARLWKILHDSSNLALFPSDLLRLFERYRREERTQDAYIAIVQFLESMRILVARQDAITQSDALTLNRCLCLAQNIQNELWDLFWAESCLWLEEQRQGLPSSRSQKLHNDFVMRIRKVNKVADPLEIIDRTLSDVKDLNVPDWRDSTRLASALSSASSQKEAKHSWSQSDENNELFSVQEDNALKSTDSQEKTQNRVSVDGSKWLESEGNKKSDDGKEAHQLVSGLSTDENSCVENSKGENSICNYDFSKVGLAELQKMVTTSEGASSSMGAGFLDACREELCKRLENFDWKQVKLGNV